MTAASRASLPHHPTLSEDERQRCEIWTRVVGYHRPVSAFNIGKRGEFQERRYFVMHRGPTEPPR